MLSLAFKKRWWLLDGRGVVTGTLSSEGDEGKTHHDQGNFPVSTP